MATSILTKEQMTRVVEPEEEQMFERQGFDRSNYRFQMASVTPVENGTKYVETGGQAYVSGDSDRAIGPTAVGESGGTIDLVQSSAKQTKLARFTHGFTLMDEDQEVDDAYVEDLRDGVLEFFDLEADVSFLDGLKDEQGNVVTPSALQWLKDNIPSGRTIDCNSITVDVPANAITEEAYGTVSGQYMETSWGTMIGKHSALSHFNAYDDTTNGSRTHMEMVENMVDDTLTIPSTVGLPTPDDQEDIEVSIDDLGDDEVILIPSNADTKFWELYEEPEPTNRVVQKEGFRERHEYRWKHGVVYDPDGHAGDATDAVLLENVSDLF